MSLPFGRGRTPVVAPVRGVRDARREHILPGGITARPTVVLLDGDALQARRLLAVDERRHEEAGQGQHEHGS
ncbi:hypothetical protein [Olsenella sp. HMSC062G07]|uniref:hypothetical protein n=1 Tax=Olsenella sp. HMSC062G07 TaxID=1739330 RepID=UPI0008ADEB5C|nr:hypothetical protein [Olsenella sp. HMSC062G07]OFK22826.1 hypothetical protein HMPREF2826_00905 [Olsenella sp. HMSC062G07]